MTTRNSHIVSKSVVMVRDSNLTVTTVTEKTVTVAAVIVKSKKDGIVKEDRASELVLVFLTLLLDHSSL